VTAIWRAIVGHVEIPYDRDLRTGKVLTFSANVLECGHTKKPFYQKNFQRYVETPMDTSQNRRCHKCEHGRPPNLTPDEVAASAPSVGVGCCSGCSGRGSTLSGPCPECYGTGHPHPDPEDCP
jgi:hypothetical protein